ncbi:hypothetical protein [Tunicatimonas pelagia]|uniref:hypothetical protein n=1 Tax=Tunicatimonas pelagia TaxID=931531 RepID=UPI0026657627|nr:hypothetical protein [Tunicatimonas pelagia]WKN40757.1 hypothetical protein P0M28_17105 [Tunicatimonas pelagia]
MIAFLHTSSIHIERFENLVRKFDQEVEVKHFVNEDLLDYAMSEGTTNTKGFNQEVQSIQNEQPKLIICTCSTYGAECDQNDNIERIDQPIVEHLVANYNKIGLAYTAKSTKRVSQDLIIRVAQKQGKKVDIVDCDYSSAWAHYENEDFGKYVQVTAEKIKTYERGVDVIFLAQASMENAKKHLSNFTKEVYASPEFGIKSYLQRIKQDPISKVSLALLRKNIAGRNSYAF